MAESKILYVHHTMALYQDGTENEKWFDVINNKKKNYINPSI